MSETDPIDYDREMAILDSITPETRPARDAIHFRAIIAARKAVVAADKQLEKAVRAARDAGDPWLIIGMALGVSKQAAFQRFGAKADEPGVP